LRSSMRDVIKSAHFNEVGGQGNLMLWLVSVSL
jgi:hypothetical protein